MKKKFILSVAAASALFFATSGANKASAAEQYERVNHNGYVYQTVNFNQEDLNKFIQNYFKSYQMNWTEYNHHPVNEEQSVQEQVPVNQQQQQSPEQVQNQPAQSTQVAPDHSQVSAYEQQVIDLTNQERAKYGLSALKLDNELSQVAKVKSQDMKNNAYFSHNSPTYGSPFDMMNQFNITYRSAGENIAKGQRSPEEVVNAWMNSEGHRKNILNSSYTHIGVGHVSDGNYWTQMFIAK